MILQVGCRCALNRHVTRYDLPDLQDGPNHSLVLCVGFIGRLFASLVLRPRQALFPKAENTQCDIPALSRGFVDVISGAG